MRVLWLCNMMPGSVSEKLGGSAGGGLWVDHVLADLRREPDICLRILFSGSAAVSGSLDDRTDFAGFAEEELRYSPELERFFAARLAGFRPDVIHIWGTEYGHTLAMARTIREAGLAERTAVSIQGLCSVYARHYAEGVPLRVQLGFSFRDLLRLDNPALQARKFRLRGRWETEALRLLPNVIGRTDWDRACTAVINPERRYFFCNETLREPFYSDIWRYASCRKHRIFASSCAYPVKGFHYLLEALTIIRKRYPDAVVSVTGGSFLDSSPRTVLRRQRYFGWMRRYALRNGLADSLEFLGSLDAEGMKRAYLSAHVFVLPSTIENSPNSLGEAMLLGVPCVAADVGGVRNLLGPGEGFVYQSSAPYMLAQYIMDIFAMEDRAETMGAAARRHALRTHDPEKNLADLLAIYRGIACTQCTEYQTGEK